MPDLTNHFFRYTIGAPANSDTFAPSDTPLSMVQLQQQYEEWKQECERQDHTMEQQMCEVEELRKDKVRYPLFFLKEGIV